VSTLHPTLQDAIYAIYGFVRIADEVVDSFHQYPKREMLADLRQQVYAAIKQKISTNPILNSFQLIVNKYGIPHDLIEAFLKSMEMDIDKQNYDQEDYKKYIYGSAEVVGLMCLKVFCNGNDTLYNELEKPARSLGEAFQKVNFLRDVKDDFQVRSRIYFPNIDFTTFTDDQKKIIEEDIANDLQKSLVGIKKLPKQSKLGVYLAYLYYNALLKRIRRVKTKKIMTTRIRVPDHIKYFLLLKARVKILIGAV
jgi:phytoene/squalene synthetase